MARPTAVALLSLALACVAPEPAVDHDRPLPEGSPALLPCSTWPDLQPTWSQADEVLPALRLSLEWFDKPSSQKRYPIAGIDHARARASLERLAELLEQSRSAEAFSANVRAEFELFVSAGWDGHGGGVLFTGYCTPVLSGSLQRDAHFRHPLFALPPDLVKGEGGEIRGRRTTTGVVPYPTRREIESLDLLAGLELVFLSSPLDAYLAHVNGSAWVRLADGSRRLFGYAGKNGREYRSLRQALVERGAIDSRRPGLAALRAWAAATPEPQVLEMLQHNDSFVFFREADGEPTGSLGLPVTAGRSLATDKRLFPPGAPVLVDAALPDGPSGRTQRQVRLMFDQDTGGAIRTAGRADVYVGSGAVAERAAGEVVTEGQLYYLFLRPALAAPRDR